MKLKTKDFFYHLPLELIAQKAIQPRDSARLLVLDKKNKKIQHRHFFEIIDFLQAGDLLVLNNSKVFPARLIGKKELTGGKIEVFLHQQKETDIWECLIGGRVKVDGSIIFSAKLKGMVIQNNNDGTWLVKFNLKSRNFFQEINRFGKVPLPPYIKRSKNLNEDKKNYQTVFADDKKIGSVAAPTAGLHFTKNLLKKIKSKGVKIEFITLHVGLGTFSPVKTNNIKEHKMHSEFLEITAKTLKVLESTKNFGGRVIAVGTTSCRALEAAELNFKILHNIKTENRDITDNKKSRKIIAGGQNLSFWTDIFIYPGYKFKVVDALITNFHLPESTLLMLVSALAGKNLILKAYQEAISKKYRFFSYGDAMFII